MFTGIVESQAEIASVSEIEQGLRICVTRPERFDDIYTGDSVAVDGICLTVETHNPKEITFCLAPETIEVTGWNKNKILGKSVNLERSLKFGNRVHGHLVSGHVEGLIQLINREVKGESQILTFEAPPHCAGYIINKVCIALNGVSLTVNNVSGYRFQVCLIPETLKRTNLGSLKLGDHCNFEADYLLKNQLEERSRMGRQFVDIHE